MERFILNTGVNTPEAGRVPQIDGLGVPHRHICLVGLKTILFVHADDLGDLWLQILTISIVLAGLFGRCHEVRKIFIEVPFGHGVRNTERGGDIRQKRADSGVFYMDSDIIKFKPFLSLETAPVYDIFPSGIEQAVDALKPCIRQVSCFNEFQVHMKWSPFSSLFERRLSALPIMQMWMFIVNPDNALFRFSLTYQNYRMKNLRCITIKIDN